MADHAHVEDLLDSYAVGALTDDALEDVESHLEECSICRAEIEKLRTMTGLLRLGVPEMDPPADLRDRVMRAARTSSPAEGVLTPAPVRLGNSQPQRWVPRVPAYWAAAAAILPLLVSGWLGIQFLTLRDSVDSARAEKKEMWHNTESVADVMGRGILVGAGTAHVDGTENAPSAGGMLYYLPSQEEGVLIVDGLPILPQGQCYQVWLISGEKSMNGGTFYLGGDGKGITVVKSPMPLSDIDTVRITMEPHGGSEQPRGNRYMWARLTRT